ncbi:MAG TPA: class I tRNA ligase family protein, partial [Anaerolineae bacterium]
RLLANNDQINWVPEHIKDGRFGNWLENNIDWGVARERYWGTPLPFWVCDDPACGHQECIGSVAELSEKSGRKFMQPRYLAQQMGRWPDPDQDGEPLDMHRPAVDELSWACPSCGHGTMHRVSEVADTWFDSGSMPVGQLHYPFENRELFGQQFPADFICEAVDQTRGWFYTLHAVSTLLFDQPCFKNVICLGHIVAEDGSKMSKSRGNVVNPWMVFDQQGADATRWYMYTASPPGNTRRFSASLVNEVVRKFMLTLWNSYSFFVTYANLNDFDPAAPAVPLAERSLMDRWLLARVTELVRTVSDALDHYDVPGATRPISEFVDDLSNWYVRRSRERFWNTGEQNGARTSTALAGDGLAAHQTMYEVLVTLSQLLAPFTPFIADAIYRNLVAGTDEFADVSVHLSRWPSVTAGYANPDLVASMALAQRVVGLGRAARDTAGLKLRQPLSEAVVGLPGAGEARSLEALHDEVMDELNVKSLRIVTAASDLVEIVVHPLPAQLGKKYGRRFPAIKAALQGMDPRTVAGIVESGQPVAVTENGETLNILPEEIEIRKTPKPGLAVAEEAGYLVAINTTITDSLRWEGYAREVARNIQVLRKDSGLEISDRIRTSVQSGAALAPVWEQFGSSIAADTLSVSFDKGEPPAGAFSTTMKLDGEEVVVGIVKACD